VPGLVYALGVLRERWWVVLLCAIVALIAAAVYVERQPKEYQATAKLLFTTNSLPSQVAGVQSNQSLDPEGDKATDVQLVTTTTVAELVIKKLDLHATPNELLSSISASNPENDYVVDVSATERHPKLAAEIANAFVEEFVVYSQQQNQAQLISGEKLINQHYGELPANDTTDRANLRGLFQKLLLLQAVETADAQVVDVATTPTSPSSPKKTETGAVALVAGLLLGVGLAFLLNLIDRRVKELEDFEELYELSALSSIPPISRRSNSQEREIALEAFRILSNGLALLTDAGRVRTVVVTSAVSGEGKTTIALGLARAAAVSGKRVILVEADLRRPSLEAKLGTDRSSTGLTSVLQEGADPIAALRPVAGSPGLEVLFCGTPPSTEANLMQADSLPGVFARLTAHADLLVVDSAPLLPVVDTRVLLDRVPVDATVIVARAGVTTRDQIRRVRAVFDQHHIGSVGLVVNALSSVSSYYYADDESTPSGRDGAAAGAPTDFVA
jgi:capsular polysaccharide biosynthesis protein